MADKDKKIKFPSLEERKKAHERKLAELELKNKLIGSQDLFATQKGTDEYLDTLSIKLKLTGGRELTIEEYLSEHIIGYRRRFDKEFFAELGRVLGISEEEMKKYRKPKAVALFFINFLYARFPYKVLRNLRKRSPWSNIPGVRICKLFQHLSVVASEQLDLYIAQVFAMLKESESLKEFKEKYSERYKLYYQLNLFGE